MNSLPLDSLDRHNWTDRIFQCLVQPSAPEDAAAAAVAVWLSAGQARSATVLLFDSSTHFIRATGQQQTDGGLQISVDTASTSVAALVAPAGLQKQFAEDCTESFVWPERLAACFVESSATRMPEHIGAIAAGILDMASVRQTIVPGARHMESMAEFAAGAGHEINNPLGSIIGQSQLLLKQETQTDRRQSLSMIGSQAWRIRDMIGDCMLFARPPQPDIQPCDLGPLVAESAGNTASALELPNDCVQCTLPQAPVLSDVDKTQVRTLVGHLVRNSLEACLNSDLEPHVTVRLRTEPAAVLLTVRDRGPGVTDELIRRHLFDPFYSGRQAGRGIGFGLPVCWQIARNHGGLILQETPSGGGSEFVVVLPISQSHAAPTE